MTSLSFLVVGTVLTVFALFIWRSRPLSPINRSFSLFAVSIAVWTVGLAMAYLPSGYNDVGMRLAFAASCFIPASFLAFSRVYPTLGHWPPAVGVGVGLGIAGIFALAALTTPLIMYEATLSGQEISRKTGLLYPIFAVYFMVAWLCALLALASKWRHARGLARTQLQYLGAAIMGPLAGSITTNLLMPWITGRSTYSWMGPYFGLVLVAILAHAIIRHRLMDLRLVVHRGLTISIAAIMSLLPATILVSYLWPRLINHLEPSEISVVLAMIALVTLLVPITRDLAERLLDRYVYRRRANYQRVVRDASRVLTGVLDLRVLLPFLQKSFANATDPEGVAIYVKRRESLIKALDERRYPDEGPAGPDDFPDTVLDALQKARDVVVADEVARERETDATRQLHHELTRLNWAIVVPLLSDNQLIGAVALGPKLSGDPFYPHDIDLLMTLANQAGIAVKNAQLYAQVVLANEYISNIVATINSGVVAIDPDGKVTMFNPTAAQLTGLTEAEVLGREATALPPCLAEALLSTVRDAIARTQPEIELSDGAVTRPILCTTSPLHDPAGSVLGAVAVFSDLTLIRELEAERRRAEQLAYLEGLASAIAHEVKNPLVAIKTFVQLMPIRRNDDRFVDDFTRIVSREVERMERLVGRLRTLSRPSQRPFRPVDVRRPLVEALEFIQASFDEKHVSLSVIGGVTGIAVMGDHGELEQLFLNLLINALEATPANGAVDVRLTRTENHITVDITDSGPGIPPELVDRVFDPFVTTKQRGSGLGLAICAGIAQAHGAKLRAMNAPEGGARFSVELPLALPTPRPVPS